MIGALRRIHDNFAGRGEAALAIPAMDGALRPNQALDEARAVLAVRAPDNLVLRDGAVLFSSGSELWELRGGTAASLGRQDNVITCLAVGRAGLAIGLEDGRILLPGGSVLESVGGRRCPTALAFDGDALLVAQGSARHSPSGWKHDLMERGSSGSVWRVPPEEGDATCLAEGLAFPYGLLVADGGTVVVTESWRHRLLRLDMRRPSRPEIVLADLPGYPARLAPAAGGGAWLCIFAPRSQLMEFVLREPGYRARMMQEVDPEYWIAPALASGRSFLEPLQGGAVKQMGILKPWAPARSYGLVIRLDAAWEPVKSLHSRADGDRHGVTSCLEQTDELLIASKGGDVILSVQASLRG